MVKSLLTTLLCCAGLLQAQLKIGVSLAPELSIMKALTLGRAEIEVVSLLQTGSNPHGYRATPADLASFETLDAVVINGIGHDTFAEEMIRASRNKPKIIQATRAVSLVRNPSGTWNSHCFLSLEGVASEAFSLCEDLQLLDPAGAALYRSNTENFVRKTNRIKGDFLEKTSNFQLGKLKCAIMHEGWLPFFMSLGIPVSLAIEPGHGIKPMASRLRDCVDRLNADGVKIIFSENPDSDRLLLALSQQMNLQIFPLSDPGHSTSLQRNLLDDLSACLDSVYRAALQTLNPPPS